MKILAIDIGGTSIKSGIAVVDETNNTIISLKNSTNFNSENPSSSIFHCIEKYVYVDYDYVAVSATGVIDNNGVVISTNGKISNYLNLDIKTLVETLTLKPTVVVNDVTAIGYAELDGFSADSINFIIALGTGIGGCLMYKNNILEGANGAFAEIGQIKIGNNTFEELASTKALIKLANTKYQLAVNSGIDFFENYSSNISYQLCLDEWIGYLAKGVEQILYCYNPQTLVIAGGISEQCELIIPLLNSKLIHMQPPYINSLTITAASQKNDAGLYGAVQKLRRELC